MVELVATALAAVGIGVIVWNVVGDRRVLLAVAWVATVCFVPVWLGVSAGFYFAPAVVAAVVVLGALLLCGAREPTLWTAADLLVAALLVACLAPALTGRATPSTLFVVVSEWGPGYVLGRVMAARVGTERVRRVVAVTFGAVALLAVVEFATGWNPWVGIERSNSLYDAWGALQERGGVVRVEGAFGHSIALGTSLAIAVTAVLGSGGLRDRTKLVLLGLLAAGAVVTFSRAGMVCAALAVALMLLFHRSSVGWSLRAAVPLLAGGAVLAVLPFVSSVFDTAGTEASGSSDYRGDLLGLVPEMAPLGLSPAVNTASDGEIYFGTFRSIDNALILSGLRYGWIPMALMVLLLVAAAVAVLRARATPEVVGIVAAVPAMLSVAFITQYGIFVFFVAGVAAHGWSLREPRSGATAVAAPLDRLGGARPGPAG